MRAELERRPLLIFCLGLILGVTVIRQPWNLLFLLVTPFLVRALPAWAIAAAGFVIGCLIGPGAPPAPIRSVTYTDSLWRVASLPKLTPFGQRCEVEQGDVRLAFRYSGDAPLCPGAVLRVRGLIEPLPESSEPYFLSRGVAGRLTAEPETVQFVEDGPWIQRVGLAWRSSFLDLCARHLSPSAAATVAALCFNADGFLDDASRDEMRRTGTTHIIAASGLQVVVLAQGLFWLMAWLPVPRWLQLTCVAAVLGLYAISTGLHPPIVRAVLMSLIANSAFLVRREPDWLSALAFSSSVYVLARPLTVYDMGFQLSFIAVLFIGLYSFRVPWKLGLVSWARRGLIRSMSTAVISFVVVSPLIAYYFGILSLVSIPANLLIVAAVAPIVIASMAALPVSHAAPWLGSLLLKLAVPLVAYIDSVLHALGGEEAAIPVPPFSAYWLAAFYALLLALWRPAIRPAESM